MCEPGITFFNTGAVKDIRSLCTCVDLVNGSFRHYSDVKNTELWTERGISWKQRENIDRKAAAGLRHV